jgi:hypothetical protein
MDTTARSRFCRASTIARSLDAQHLVLQALSLIVAATMAVLRRGLDAHRS